LQLFAQPFCFSFIGELSVCKYSSWPFAVVLKIDFLDVNSLV
jgi:hypothetical protein